MQIHRYTKGCKRARECRDAWGHWLQATHGTAHNTCKKKKKRTMQCQKAERGRHFRHSCPHPRASLSGCCAPLPRLRKPRCVRYLDRSMIEGNERSPLQRLEPEHRTKQNTKEVLKSVRVENPTPPQSESRSHTQPTRACSGSSTERLLSSSSKKRSAMSHSRAAAPPNELSCKRNPCPVGIEECRRVVARVLVAANCRKICLLQLC